jgi:DNA-binding response OmpR family regulator
VLEGKGVANVFFHLSRRRIWHGIVADVLSYPELYDMQFARWCQGYDGRPTVMEERVPRLLVQGGEEKGREIPLAEKTLTIGRLDANDLVVADRLASRRHAVLEREHGQYAIRDLASRNGTFVNGERISEPCVLRDGDEIQIGLEFKVLYVDPEATGALVTDAIVRGRGLWVDEERREVWIQGRKLTPSLSRSQFSLLSLLQGQPGRVFTRDEIIAAVWPEDASQGVTDETIDALVGRLRRRLTSLDSTHQYVVTVRGHGFKFMQPWEQ